MAEILLAVVIALVAFCCVILLVINKKVSRSDMAVLSPRLDAFEKAQERTERTVREEVSQNREELGKAAREQRQELIDTFKAFGDSVVRRMTDVTDIQKGQLEAFSNQLGSFAKASGERLDAGRAESAMGAKQLREEVVATLTSISETTTKTMRELASAQKGQLEAFGGQLAALTTTSGEKLEGVRAESSSGARQLREEVVATLTSISESMSKTMTDLASAQKAQLESFGGNLVALTTSSGERLDAVRAESATGSKQLREEVVGTLKSISETMTKTIRELAAAEKTQLDTFSGQIGSLTRSSGEKLDGIRTESSTGAKQLREEVIGALKGIGDVMSKTMGELANTQKTQIEAMAAQVGKLSETNEKKLEAVRATVEGKLQSIQADNAAKLEQMRATVEEKLQGTLEKRLGESFKQVCERLEQVHKGLGEMQVLATGVGDLKKVLTNVKMRGTWGEIQLGALLEQILTPEQYSQNVATKKGSNERVEFAIRFPGRDGDGDGEPVWLPIDAKCPIEDYQRLFEAQERGDIPMAAEAAKQLEARVRSCAKDIRDKYINPPATTDFAIMYLPTEGLYAEAIRRPGLVELLQRECRVNICGPTTLAAMLNSLQMGFRSLAIQKRSSEVWQVLGAVKTEFGKFGDVLDKVHKKLDEAGNTIDDASKRTRAIERKLRTVEELPLAEAHKLILDADATEA